MSIFDLEITSVTSKNKTRTDVIKKKSITNIKGITFKDKDNIDYVIVKDKKYKLDLGFTRITYLFSTKHNDKYKLNTI